MIKYFYRIIKRGLHLFRTTRINKYYDSLLKKNGIKNYNTAEEKEWIKKWSGFKTKPHINSYRLFSHYIGHNVNIVPETISNSIESYLNPAIYRPYYSDKNIYDKIFPEGFLPKTVLRKCWGGVYNADYELISVDGFSLCAYLDELKIDKVIIKPTVESQSGRKVIMAKKIKDSWRIHGTDELLTLDYLMLHYEQDEFIIQECVEQSEFMSQFNPTSVNTIRLSLYHSIKDNQWHITSGIMRIGGKGSVVDNAHAGGMFVGIKENGTLCNYVCDQFGNTKTEFNGLDFSSNFSIPKFNEIKDFARSVGEFVPHCRLLALDIVQNREGNPQLIEFNCEGYSMWLYQFTVGPAFGQFTDEIIEYCKKQEKESPYIYLYYKGIS